MLGVVSSMTAISEEVIFALLTVVLTCVLGFIFYPAISLALTDSIAIEEEDVSTAASGKYTYCTV
jgi:Tfp pilus assembly protein PilO